MTTQHDMKTVVVDEVSYETTLTRKYLQRRAYQPVNPDALSSVIPGVVRQVQVAAGQRVRRGDRVLVLEAMKMQNNMVSPRDATVKAVHVREGDMVPKGKVLVELE